MADSPFIDWSTGKNVYGVLRNAAQQIWDTTGTPAFETYAGGSWADYDISTTEQATGASSGRYVLTLPTLTAGIYDVTFYERAGGSPSLTADLKIGLFTFVWDGTGFSLGGSSGLDAAGVRSALGMTTNNLDAQLSTIDTVVDGIKAKTDALPSDPADASVVAGRFDTLDASVAVVDGVADAIKAKTDNLPSDPADASVIAGRFDTLDSAVAVVDGVADAIKLKTDALPSDPADQSLIIAATDALAGLIATVDTVVDGIKLKTDALPSDPADASVIAGRFDTVDAALATVSTFDPSTDTVDVGRIDGSAPAAQIQRIFNLSVLQGNVSGTPTASSIQTDTALSTTDGAYRGMVLHFVSGTLKGQNRVVSDYTGATKTFTFSGVAGRPDIPFLSAPTAGDDFVLLGRGSKA